MNGLEMEAWFGMPNFAELDENNVVININSVHENSIDPENEEESGIDFLESLHGHRRWKRYSFNTAHGVHMQDGVPFRKNAAAIGYIYDEERDAFVPPKPFESWTLDEEICEWLPPVDAPVPPLYRWSEAEYGWILLNP
jgi:hypothetical protein